MRQHSNDELDRALLNAHWISNFVTEVTHLHGASSDHLPLLLSASTGSCFGFNAGTKHQ